MAEFWEGALFMAEAEKFYIQTLGCKINQYESQVLREAWQSMGLQETDQPELAAHILINSCAVTERAVQDLRRTARRLYRTSPEARIVVTGCAAAGLSLEDLSWIDKAVPQLEKANLLNSRSHTKTGTEQQKKFHPLQGITDFPRARPVLKVQDGCSSQCTYCIVPLTRGRSKSRSQDDILKEAHNLADAGFQELVLSGINLAQFKFEHPWSGGFWDLVSWLDQTLSASRKNPPRLRLSSLDPGILDSQALEVLAASSLICPHLHLSLQSASPKILQAMGRKNCSMAHIQDFLNALTRIWPVFGLGADILLGFPGERQQDFEETLQFCSQQLFSYTHVFVYSPRPGTKAVQFSEQVPEKEKKRRSQIFRSRMEAQKRAFWERLSCKDNLEVVLEQTRPALGLCEYYVPCILKDKPQGLGAKDRVRVEPTGWDAQGIQVKVKEAADKII